MPLQSPRNLYPGINAHLNSYLQSEDGGWESFHAGHIIDISRMLNRHLPPKYYATHEKSLQMSQISFATAITRRAKPDVTVYQQTAQSFPTNTSQATPVAILPLALEDEDDYLTSVVIYEVEEGKIPGTPVTRIELLSPSNKPGHSDYRQYMARRIFTLRSGLSLVEVDYLHETQPILSDLPSYPEQDEGAYPYLVLVSNPHPKPERGQTKVYAFEVGAPLSTIDIPLAGDDIAPLNLGAVYNQTFENDVLLQLVVDYAVEPERMDTYTPADQARIRQRMASIQAEHASDESER
jgi:hypothetical protein